MIALAPLQRALEALLARGADATHEARVRELKRSRGELETRLSRIPGVIAIPSEGNFVLLDISATGMRPEEVLDAMLDEGVLIRSLSSHHAGRSYVRVTVGTREQVATFLSELEKIWK